MNPREEEELRNLIRRELESREHMRGEHAGYQEMRRGSQGLTDERRQIIEEEIAAYYRSRGGYIRYENEDGDIEWLTEAELREREGQIPVDMEELEVGQRMVRNRMIALLVLAFVCVGLLIALMRDRTGTIQVISNVPGATVSLNGSPTEFKTDARLDQVSVGPHVISISKDGYVPDGSASKRVDLRAGRTEIVVLNLKPGRMDSVGGQREN